MLLFRIIITVFSVVFTEMYLAKRSHKFPRPEVRDKVLAPLAAHYNYFVQGTNESVGFITLLHIQFHALELSRLRLMQ